MPRARRSDVRNCSYKDCPNAIGRTSEEYLFLGRGIMPTRTGTKSRLKHVRRFGSELHRIPVVQTIQMQCRLPDISNLATANKWNQIWFANSLCVFQVNLGIVSD